MICDAFSLNGMVLLKYIIKIFIKMVITIQQNNILNITILESMSLSVVSLSFNWFSLFISILCSCLDVVVNWASSNSFFKIYS
jgi:hypothetical protein